MVVLYFLHTSDGRLYHFSIVVRVKLRSCTPKELLWEAMQTRSSLLTCRSSTLCSFFLHYTTRWRRFLSEYFLTLPSHPRCTPTSIGPSGYCFRVRKNNWLIHLLFFKNEPKSHVQFCCTFWNVEKMIRFVVHDCFVEIFYCVIDYIVSRSFKLRIHQEVLTWAQLLFKIRNINFLDDLVQINFCYFDRKAMLGLFILT